MTIKTNYKYNFDQAEDDNFSWSHFDGSNGGSLTHKATGREIYQMQWVDQKTGYVSEPVTGETREQALAFWNELYELQHQPIPASDEPAEPEPEHGKNGYCRRCHSYCWGDCQSH